MIKVNTMEQLSETIGISRPTLSRYFQDPASVRESTRIKIETALKGIDYVPNFFATNLNRKTSKLVGLVLPRMNDLFYTTLIDVIEKAAGAKGYTVVIQNSQGIPCKELLALETLRSMHAAGVILAPVGEESDVDALTRIARDLPMVLVDAFLPGAESDFPYVGTDNAKSAALMVDYLCGSGSPPIFFNLPWESINSKIRSDAYDCRMKELGHVPQHLLSDSEPVGTEFELFGYETMKAAFAAGQYREATILCTNDRLAMGVVRAANEFGLFHTADGARSAFRVAGHDDHPHSAYMWPSLTTACQDTSNIGATAFEMLLTQASGGDMPNRPKPKRMLDAELVLRHSA